MVLNPDDPSRAVNSPSRVYQVEDQAFTLLRQFHTPQWERSLSAYLEHRAQQLAAYAELYGWESKRAVQERSVSVPEREAQSTCHKHGRDLFICHASEDKGSVARPLAGILISHGLTVWLDELELSVGDSLNSRIEAALTHSCFGVVVLSPAFFAKEWPKRELSGLVAREIATGAKVILPVWHNVDRQYIVRHAPILADRIGAQTSCGIRDVADKLLVALGHAGVPVHAESVI